MFWGFFFSKNKMFLVTIIFSMHCSHRFSDRNISILRKVQKECYKI